ncbi:MAG: cupin domain-containing protein [Chitinophagaceae bacterium]|nr:cupin domain-containing protein [Chitinophagaceae bacterium]
MTDKIKVDLKELPASLTAHMQGKKFVFLKNEETNTALTQFAYGELLPGEVIAEHLHPSMEEYFYFLGGRGNYKVGKENYAVETGSFVRIPAGTIHELSVRGNDNLLFVYCGIALSQ